MQVCKHFQAVRLNFDKYPKFIIMDILVNVNNVKGAQYKGKVFGLNNRNTTPPGAKLRTA